VAVLVVTIGLAPGCAPHEPSDQALVSTDVPTPGGTMIVAASTDLRGVNELLSASDSFSQSVLRLQFLQLFQEQPDFDQHPPTFAPELAASWEWSADGTLLTLHLRTDVRWSNGEPVTAADVEWTWQAQIHPDVAWSLADTKENIAAVEAVDEHTVRVTYQKQNVTQLADLNEGVILPRSVWGQLPFAEWRQSSDWFLDHLITNGPFVLRSWDRQQQVVLDRYEGFYKPARPFLDTVVFRIVPQKVNQVGYLLAGDVQFVDHIPAAEAARIASSPTLDVLTYWARQYDFICWNTARPLFEDPEIRRALTLSIDRQALVDALWFGHARVASSPIISTVWAHNSEVRPWPYDPEAARRILERHGWSDADGDGVLDRQGQSFAFELMTNTNSAVRVDAAVMIQEHLRRAGIRMEIRRLEFNTLVESSLAHDFDAMLGGWTIDTSMDLDYAFHTESIDGGYNFGSFSNPAVNELLDLARDQTDPTRKGEILGQVQGLLHEEQPYTFLWEPQRLTGIALGLRDAQSNALDPFFRLEDWWLVPTQ